MIGLHEATTRVTCSTSSLIDHSFASFPSRVFQKGVIDIGLLDHYFIFCTRKISKFKTGGVQIGFMIMKN